MNKIDFNIIAVILVLIFIVAACNKDDSNLNEASHQVIFTSEMDFENTIEVNGELSFGDVSSGIESRIWTFPEGVVDIIDSENDLTSTEGNVKTVWNEIGVYEVNLKQTFTEDAYVGTVQQGKELESNIIVTVLDSIQNNFEAHYINPDGTIGAALDISDSAENEIPAARSVRFTWTGLGEPEVYTWDFERADPAEISTMDSIIDVRYKFLGTFDLSLIGSRSRPFGRDTLFLEDFIKVVPSTDPVVVEEIYELDGKIALSFQRELEPNTLEDSDFSISVYNDGELITDTFESTSINPDEGNVVLIDLGMELIYNNDSITVSFVGGNLMSLDGVTATSFTDEQLVFRKINILAGSSSGVDYSFESTTTDEWISLGWDGFTESSFEISSDQAYEGNSSLYIEMNAEGGIVIRQRDLNIADPAMNFVTFPANATKDYEIGSWVYVEELGSTDPNELLQPDLRYYYQTPELSAFGGDRLTPLFDPEFPTNQWVYSSGFVKFDETSDFYSIIRGWNPINPESLKFYIDNMVLYEVKLRP